MAIDYGGITKKSLKFAFTPKRWLQFFILDAAFFLTIIAMIMNDWVTYITAIALVMENAYLLFAAEIFFILLPFIILVFVWLILRVYLTAAMIHQSFKGKEFNKSFAIARKKIISFLAIMIILGILDLSGNIPYIGFIFSLILALVFFVSLQACIVNNLGFWKSIKTSYIVLKRKPGSVITMFLIVGVISIVIMGIFSLPFVSIYINFLGPSLEATGSNILSVMLVYLVTNFYSVILFGLIFILGGALSYTYTLKAQTEFYLKVRKRKLGIF